MQGRHLSRPFAAISPLTDLRVWLDPARIQWRLACRVLLSMLGVTLALVALHDTLPFSPAAYALALSTTMIGQVSVRDATPSERAGTRLVSVGIGFGLISVIALLDHALLAVNLLLLGVVFGAMFIRHIGSRWQAVGLYAFMCCVLSGYLKPVQGQLVGIGIALVLASVVNHLVRNHVLVEDTRRDFHRLMLAQRAAVRRFCRAIVPASQGVASARRARALSEHAAISAIQQAQAYLPLNNPGQADGLAVDLLGLRLSLRAAVLSADDPATRDDVQGRTREILALERRIRSVATALPPDFFTTSAPAPAAPATDARAANRAGLILAIQVTLATAIAMVAGLQLSEQRWFWAVLTAFIVFSNTQSRGETLIRGLARAGGTALGVVLGSLLATVVAGAMAPTIALVALFLFVGYFLMAKSYSAFTLCLTMAISLVYGLLGTFTPALMLLRLEETLIGAAAGILVSFAVLPTSTLGRLTRAFQDYLNAMDACLATFATGVAPGSGALARLRAVNTAKDDVMQALSPWRSPWNLGARNRKPQLAAIRVSAMQQWVETALRGFTLQVPAEADMAVVQEVRDALAALQTEGFDLFSTREPESVAGALDTAAPSPSEAALRGLLAVLRQVRAREPAGLQA